MLTNGHVLLGPVILVFTSLGRRERVGEEEEGGDEMEGRRQTGGLAEWHRRVLNKLIAKQAGYPME